MIGPTSCGQFYFGGMPAVLASSGQQTLQLPSIFTFLRGWAKIAYRQATRQRGAIHYDVLTPAHIPTWMRTASLLSPLILLSLFNIVVCKFGTKPRKDLTFLKAWSLYAGTIRCMHAIGALSLCCFAGCTHLTFNQVTDPKAPISGVRYNRPAPYLLVSAGAQGGCDAKVIWLPDPQQEVEIRTWWFGIGTVSEKPTLTDGWNLTALDSSIDTKFPETITALAGAAKTAGALASVEERPPSQPSGGFWAVDPRFPGNPPTVTGLGLYKINLPSSPSTGMPFLTAVSLVYAEGGKLMLCPSLKAPAPEQTKTPAPPPTPKP